MNKGHTTKNIGVKNKKIWVFVASVLAIVLTAQLVVSNILAARGNELAKLDKEAAILSRNNQTIKQEMSQHGSLTKIAVLAEGLGMVKPESLIYIDVGQAVAALPSVQ